MIAMQSTAQNEILYDSPWVSWKRVPAGNAKAWIRQIKFYDRWLFPVTDESGRLEDHHLMPIGASRPTGTAILH